MPQFTVTALNENGQEVSCTVEGETEEKAFASVRASGLVPTGIKGSSASWAKPAPEASRANTPRDSAPTAAGAIPPLKPYSTPFIVGLHGFAGGLAGLGFIFALIALSVNGPSEEGLLFCVSAGLAALINFGLAQIIDIIARASYAAREQVELLRQLVRANGQEPRV